MPISQQPPEDVPQSFLPHLQRPQSMMHHSVSSVGKHLQNHAMSSNPGLASRYIKKYKRSQPSFNWETTPWCPLKAEDNLQNTVGHWRIHVPWTNPICSPRLKHETPDTINMSLERPEHRCLRKNRYERPEGDDLCSIRPSTRFSYLIRDAERLMKNAAHTNG